MAILSENMVFSKTRTHDLKNVKQLNCWGSELTDVSLVRQMPYVQVLSLSVNFITTLEHFGACRNLQELYLRDNKIGNLNEVLYLVDLPNLKKLWLKGNPCADRPNYRMTVIKNLPNLQLLDDIEVSREEMIRAESQGDDLNLDDDPHPTSAKNRTSNSHASSVPPKQEEEVYDDGEEEEEYEADEPVVSQQPVVRVKQEPILSSTTPQPSPQAYVVPSSVPRTQTRPPPAHLVTPVQSAVPPPPPTNMVRSSSTAEYAGFSDPTSSSPLHYPHPPYNGQSERRTSQQAQQKLLPKGGKNRNANILSAVLCLIKELDVASLEVVDTEIHCRMEDMNN